MAGETGSGKSTQIPKLCLELGRGVEGYIGHTQPRRIAARSIADRIAEELGTVVGGIVGYAVRFSDKVGDDTLVKVMTDGLLLAESPPRPSPPSIRHDHYRRGTRAKPQHRLPARLPQIAAPQAPRPQADHHLRHHRHDTILSALRRRTRRRGLRTGTTPSRSAIAHSTTPTSQNPVIRRKESAMPLKSCWAKGPATFWCSARASGRSGMRPELSGRCACAHTEILPLYARLSASEQQRVFRSHTGRRIVLATNVAETSLTVPGIRYVVDPGTARISRYSRRTKVQRLPIEPITQASADQRAGRCGRLGPGICIRLYDEADFDARPQFTEPEIQRTNLASVILQMSSLGLGDVESFPFLDPPDRRSIRDGVALLEELGAVDPGPGRDRSLADPARSPNGETPRRPAPCPNDHRVRRQRVSARGPDHCLGPGDSGSSRATRREGAAGRSTPRPLQGPGFRPPQLASPVGLREHGEAIPYRRPVPPNVP